MENYVTMETPKMKWAVAATMDGRLLSFNELIDMADRNATVRCDEEETCRLFMGAETGEVEHCLAKPMHSSMECVSVDIGAVAVDVPFGKFVRPGHLLDDWSVDRMDFNISGVDGRRDKSWPLVACFNTSTGTNMSIDRPEIGISMLIETLPSGAHQPLPLCEGDVVVVMEEGRYHLFYTLGREASNWD